MNLQGINKSCKCDSSRCYVNSGVNITNADKFNGALHKHSCCRACRARFCGGTETEEKVPEESGANTPMKLRAQGKGEEAGSPKSASTDSKKKGSGDTITKGYVSKDLWNFSTRIVKNDKTVGPETDKKKMYKGSKGTDKGEKSKNSKKKRIKSPDEGGNDTEVDESRKGIRGDKGVPNQCKENEGYTRKHVEDPETIYISYSLKGFIKIKSRNELEICDTYYGKSDFGQACVCRSTDDEFECVGVDEICEWCEDCEGIGDQYFVTLKSEEPCLCIQK